MADVYLFQGSNDGEISVKNGVIELTDGLESAVYISLFGVSTGSYWGDLINGYEITSQTAKEVSNSPLSLGRINIITQAVESDLSWIKTQGLAANINVSVNIETPKRIRIILNIDGIEINFVVNKTSE